MHRTLRFLVVILALICVILAQEAVAVNKAASFDESYAPVISKEDLLGTTHRFGDAEQANAPKWGQITSLGLGVWRLLLFTFMVVRYALQPVLYVLHILHSVTRPITLLIQLIYHITLGIPLSLTAQLFKTLYPAYLFLGSAAIIGIFSGLGISVFSRVVKLLFEHPVVDSTSLGPTFTSPAQYDTPTPKKPAGRQPKHMFPQKRSPPSTRSIMSTQSLLQTPTILEESEASSFEGGADYNTDSDSGTSPTRHAKDYLNYKPASKHDNLRRRK